MANNADRTKYILEWRERNEQGAGVTKSQGFDCPNERTSFMQEKSQQINFISITSIREITLKG